MADQWYYAQGSERKGPVEAGALKALADAGVVTPDTLVWREGMADWEPAFRHVPGLVPSMPGQAARAPSYAAAHGGAGGRDYFEQVGMAEAFKRFWRNYVNFSGRSNRGEFWWAILALILISIVIAIVDAVVFDSSGQVQPLSSLWSLATFLPSLSLAVRRLHDIDRTGWWVVAPTVLGVGAALLAAGEIASGNVPTLSILLGLGALVMLIVILVWNCSRGTPGPNRFG